MKAINQLAELQQRLVVSDTEMSALVKELGLDDSKNGENGADTDETKKAKKRKRSESDDDEDDDEDSENENDDDDEEIFSDTDEEMKADEAKRAKKSKKVANFTFTDLNPNEFEEYLSKFNREFQKYR